MGEFARMKEDWGLQAIVSGCTDDLSAAMSSSFDDLLFDYPNIFEAKSGDYNNNEFDQLYKPFHQVFDDSFSSQSPIGSGTDTPLSSSFNDKALKLKSQELKMKKGPKTTYKKRKNQHKKMVLQAESLSSDPWAWRKYGQKPIKGSPYPRSYYKCSSSKECVARKQVEESCSDPGMFIITYSGEHNHTQPTRRRSLAGTTRHRFTPHATSSSSSVATVPKDCDSSPTTPLSSVNIEESTMFQQAVVKNAKNINLVNEEKSCSEDSKDDSECVISDDMLMNDDFFVGLEDLDRLISESGFYSFPYQSL